MSIYKKIRASLDSIPEDVWLEAFTDGSHWNGFVTPVFEKESALELCKHMPELTYDELSDSFVYSTEYEEGPDIYGASTIEVDGQPTKVYSIGTFGWCWFGND